MTKPSPAHLLELQRAHFRRPDISGRTFWDTARKDVYRKIMADVRGFVAAEIEGLLAFVGWQGGADAKDKVLEETTQLFRGVVRKSIMYLDLEKKESQDLPYSLTDLWEEAEALYSLLEDAGMRLASDEFTSALATQGLRYWQEALSTPIVERFSHRKSDIKRYIQCNDPLAALEEVAARIDAVLAEPDFEAINRWPGLIERAAFKRADLEEFLRYVIGPGKDALEADFPQFKDNPYIYYRALILNPKAPKRFLERKTILADKLAADPEFSSLTRSIIDHAAVYYRYPRQRLRAIVAAQKEIATDPQFKHPYVTTTVINFTLREYSDWKSELLRGIKKYDELINLPEFAVFKAENPAGIAIAVCYYADPIQHLREVLKIIEILKTQPAHSSKTFKSLSDTARRSKKSYLK